MRLIDADAAKNKIRREMANADLDKLGFAICLALINMFDDAGELPTIEAEPVRHGWWVVQDEGRTRYMCSLCESKNYRGCEKYCPNCGAKMDKEEVT
ncbi:MAG: hypothetical protein IJN11_05480 [Oscillospiraceae bacterium]|nr:hypothetical protein [Oscillospiraceae bacterium]